MLQENNILKFITCIFFVMGLSQICQRKPPGTHSFILAAIVPLYVKYCICYIQGVLFIMCYANRDFAASCFAASCIGGTPPYFICFVFMLILGKVWLC